MSWLLRFWKSSIGGKVIMAVTGVLLFLFLIGHLAGNLLLLKGAEAMNGYAAWLKANPTLIWTVRAGLLAVFVLHVATGIRLSRVNRDARGVGYTYEDTVQASYASRSMLLSGLVVLAFVLYHLLHFTFGVTNPGHYQRVDELGRHDVYAMVVLGFSEPGIVAAYVLAMVLLFLHLVHGLPSLLQTIGINEDRWTPLLHKLAFLLAIAIAAGNVFIPLAVLTGMVGATP